MKQKKILIVEDDPDIRTALQWLLSFEGYETSVAENGIAAKKLLNSIKVDLILLDLMMPEMNGGDFLMELRSGLLTQPSQTPVIVLSASGAPGFDQILNQETQLKKPVDSELLLSTIIQKLQIAHEKASVITGDALLLENATPDSTTSDGP